MSAASHTHDDHGHHHDHGLEPGQPRRDERRLGFAFAIVIGFAAVEAVGGWWFNSLTLLADAGHMVLDASALWLAWYAMRLARRAHDERLSYGYHRFQVLAAFINALTLLVLCVWIVVEAVVRLRTPVTMAAAPALGVATLGLLVNWIAWRVLHSTEQHEHGAGHPHQHSTAPLRNMNLDAAAMHVLGDLLGSVAAIIAAATVLLTGWPYADPLLAFVIVAILVRGSLKVLLGAGHILLEGVPEHLDLDEIRRTLTERIEAVREVHHMHAWALTTERPLITLHATLEDGSDAERVVRDIKSVLHERFGIEHSTIQVDHGPCPDD